MPAFQVTLTNADTNYSLLTLVRAVDTSFVDVGDVIVQADDDGGVQIFKLGDSSLGAARYGALMRPGDYSPRYKDLGGLYARCDTPGKNLNVSIIR